jgi:hypothetical protein
VELVDIERSKVFKNHKLEEIKILDIIESVCDPKHEYGMWLKSVDVVQASTASGKYLELTEPGGIG